MILRRSTPTELAKCITKHKGNKAIEKACWDQFTKWTKGGAEQKQFWKTRETLKPKKGVTSINVSTERATSITVSDKDSFDEGVGFAQPSVTRQTLDRNKLYLDSMASHHVMFTDWYLRNVETADQILRSNCNAGEAESNKVGWWAVWQFYLQEQGIANLLSIPQLEDEGCKVRYSTDDEWVVTLPDGKDIVFKRDSGVCHNMPYIDIQSYGEEAITLVQTVRKNFEESGLTQREIKRVILAGEGQAKTGHHPDGKFKKLVSSDGF